MKTSCGIRAVGASVSTVKNDGIEKWRNKFHRKLDLRKLTAPRSCILSTAYFFDITSATAFAPKKSEFQECALPDCDFNLACFSVLKEEPAPPDSVEGKWFD